MRPYYAILLSVLGCGAAANAQLIVADDYTGSGQNFTLGSGVNSGINPPATRLTGSAVADLRYIELESRSAGLYRIVDNKFRIVAGAANASAVLSSDGTKAYNFASALGSGTATPLNPITYDITISMANIQTPTTTPRMSVGFGTVEPTEGVGLAGAWDFGLQLHRNASGGTAYGVSKRIDMTSGQGLAADANTVIHTTADGTYGTMLDFLIRVTDAGAETSTYNSRVRVSMDGGNTFFYDTATDSSITGFRFDGEGRFFNWDVAGTSSDSTSWVEYDNFSVRLVPEPSSMAMILLGGAMFLGLRRRS